MGGESEATVRISTTDLTAIVGMRGSGKTTLTRGLIEIAGEQGVKNIVVYDPLREYDNPEVERYVPTTPWGQAEFDALCKKLAYRGNCWFVVEEADRYLPQRGLIPQWASILVNQGRHYGIGMVAISRRIASLSKDYFSLCEHLCIYRLWIPNDISYIREFLPREQANRVAILPKYHFLYFSSEETDTYTLQGGRLIKIGKAAIPPREKGPISPRGETKRGNYPAPTRGASKVSG